MQAIQIEHPCTGLPSIEFGTTSVDPSPETTKSGNSITDLPTWTWTSLDDSHPLIGSRAREGGRESEGMWCARERMWIVFSDVHRSTGDCDLSTQLHQCTSKEGWSIIIRNW
ncbi:unnamed protein product [[Candida] boidinii]|nr:unnamed protein product [[Candida] boidinii]